MCHTCPECGDICYCDMDDLDLGDDPPDDCPHVCDPDFDNCRYEDYQWDKEE